MRNAKPQQRVVYWDEIHGLACHYRMLTGKWVAWIAADAADAVWQATADLMIRNKLGTHARISTTNWAGFPDETEEAAREWLAATAAPC